MENRRLAEYAVVGGSGEEELCRVCSSSGSGYMCSAFRKLREGAVDEWAELRYGEGAESGLNSERDLRVGWKSWEKTEEERRERDGVGPRDEGRICAPSSAMCSTGPCFERDEDLVTFRRERMALVAWRLKPLVRLGTWLSS